MKKTCEECERCDGSIPLGIDGGAHDFRIYANAIFYYDEQLGWEGETINFCPWCGREFDHEPPQEARP